MLLKRRHLMLKSLYLMLACLLLAAAYAGADETTKENDDNFFQSSWSSLKGAMGDLIGPGASSPELNSPVVFQVEKISRLRSDKLKPERAIPVYDNGRVYVVSSRKKLVAFNLSGERALEHELEWAPAGAPLIKDGGLYIGGDDGGFHCLNIATGEEKWNNNLQLMNFSRPATTDNVLVFQTGRDRVLALSRDTGEWVWEHQHLRAEDLALQSLCPSVIKDGVLFAGLSGGAVVSIEAETGKLLWKTVPFDDQKFRDVDAPLRVDEDTVFAVSAAGKTAALSRKTGRTYWMFERGGMAGAALEGDTLYLATDRGEMIAIDKVTGEEQWSTELSARKKKRFFDLPTRPLVRGEHIVTVSHGGRVFVIDKYTGKIDKHYFYYTDTSVPAVPVEEEGFLVIDNQGLIRYWQDLQ